MRVTYGVTPTLVCAAVTVLLLHAGRAPAYAEAFRIISQSASAAGQAGAFAAQADDASAIYYNPAGMTQLRGVQLSVGTLLIGGHTDFHSPTGADARGDLNGSVASPPPSNFYLTANLQDLGLRIGDLVAGLAVVSRFGLLTPYRTLGWGTRCGNRVWSSADRSR